MFPCACCQKLGGSSDGDGNIDIDSDPNTARGTSVHTDGQAPHQT